MLKLKDIVKNERGITLIALIITVVVIVIIASIAISVAIGNNGLVNMSLTAKDENTKGIATETMNLKITNVEMSAYIEKHRLPTLKELADNFCEDDDFDKVVEKTEVASLDKITNENPTAIIAKLKQYPYEFEIDSSLRLASIDGVRVANNQNEPNGNGNELQQIFSRITETSQVEEFNFVANKKDGQIYTVPEDGYYKIECWGAQGGTENISVGGKGAYTKGIIKLSKDEKIYVYVGECYNGHKAEMSFNGGGSGTYYTNRYHANAGGATDVRIQSENADWDDFESLKSRIMVAAGGGGGYGFTEHGSFRITGGPGGALTSKNGSWCGTGTGSTNNTSLGATQISGGIERAATKSSQYNGSFGKGGYPDYGSNDFPPGGGGYYGGATGGAAPNIVYQSTGGSSYISGHEGCNSIASSSTENNIIHTGSIIHYSGRYFLYTQMEPGDNYMPLSSNTSQEELGHSGSGHVKITKMNME